MTYGKPPFSGMNIGLKLRCITDNNYKINYGKYIDFTLIDVIKSCLQRDPRKRPSIPDLLNHPYLHPSRFIQQMRENAQQPSVSQQQ